MTELFNHHCVRCGHVTTALGLIATVLAHSEHWHAEHSAE